MTRVLTVSDSVVVDADPLLVYDKVSDPTAMGSWSPENQGATVRDEHRKAYPGMVFDGRNKRGLFSWTTRCTVTAADPGELFAFRVHAIGVKTPRIATPIATWEYRFEKLDGATKVTETWTDDRRRWPDPVVNVFDRLVTRGRTFADFQRRNIRATLDNLAGKLQAPGR